MSYWIVVAVATSLHTSLSYGAFAHYGTLAECQRDGERLIRDTDKPSDPGMRQIDLEWHCQKVGVPPPPPPAVIVHNAAKDEE